MNGGNRLGQCLENLMNKLLIEDVFALISFVLKCCRYALLTPFKSTPDRRFVLLRRYYIFCAVVLISANCVVLFQAISELSSEDMRNPYSLLSFSRHLANVAYLFLITISVLGNSSRWINVLNAMAKWESLHSLSKDLRKTFTITTLLQFAYFFIRAALYLYSVIVFVEDAFTFRYYCLIIFCLLTIYTEAVYTMVICNLGWLNVCFDGIYREIRKKLVPEEECLLCTHLYELRNNMCKVGRRKKLISANDISILRYSYGKFLDIERTINDCYAVIILVTITSVFFDLVFFVFFLISVFQFWNYIKADAYLINKFRLLILHIFSQITKLVFTVFLCDRLKTKGDMPFNDLYKSILTVSDPEAKNELLIFSVEMLHRSTKISAAGFFNVDFELLHTIIAAVTVYTIMLIQFDFPIPKQGDNPIVSLCKFILKTH